MEIDKTVIVFKINVGHCLTVGHCLNVVHYKPKARWSKPAKVKLVTKQKTLGKTNHVPKKIRKGDDLHLFNREKKLETSKLLTNKLIMIFRIFQFFTALLFAAKRRYL